MLLSVRAHYFLPTAIGQHASLAATALSTNGQMMEVNGIAHS